MNIGEKYLSKRDNETVIRIIEVDDIRKTVIYEYENGKNKGKSTCVGYATIRRWYSLISEEQNTASDISSDSEEKSSKKPTNRSKKSSNKIDRTQDYKNVLEALSRDFDVKEYTSSPGCMAVKNKGEKKNIAYVEVRQKYIKVYFGGKPYTVDYEIGYATKVLDIIK